MIDAKNNNNSNQNKKMTMATMMGMGILIRQRWTDAGPGVDSPPVPPVPPVELSFIEAR